MPGMDTGRGLPRRGPAVTSAGRPASPQARLRLLLLALALWDLVGFLVELAFDSPAFRIKGDVEGFLAARAFSGSLIVLAAAYIYAARNPLRHRIVIWMAVLEQLAALFTGIAHWMRADLSAGQAILPLLVALGFLVLILLNYPRERETT